ncbi:multidrug efflux SMR transporter [Nocardiopsis sp. MG754419]|uniref:DMT family transporter n=1 Tax=Nocardiopsis sp. MG754419 TaxID=2259865 RepID=UPI001BAAE36D|nr:multidrug efflux SMR transporter [Nocardiopsis sp. MG754419]MBR8742385.1 QacE family quaternary ammonium compound efflux SMR transporter [Nocardiopsis sp. MG754419]
MSLAYLFLAGTITLEVTGAIASRRSEGFTRPLPTAVTVLTIVGAYYLFALALHEGLGLGVAYALWAAIGIVAVAVIGVLALRESLTRTQVVGIGLTVAGVLALQWG